MKLDYLVFILTISIFSFLAFRQKACGKPVLFPHHWAGVPRVFLSHQILMERLPSFGSGLLAEGRFLFS